ncbi:MAG: carboxypeptidase regulatory-like domain-containing protein [Phycisphaerae bacterium]|nr:carboxypeptidase regulatory-like domain-containing protein [Phycisphaerae bacterium]
MNPVRRIEHHIRVSALPGTRQADERILNAALSAFEQAGSEQGAQVTSRVRNQLTKAIAAVIVIGVLIPFVYGASKIIRVLVVKPAGQSAASVDFRLDKDLFADLRIGNEEMPETVRMTSVRFFVEDGQLRGTLRSDVCSWPKLKWRTRIVLLDQTGRRLASTEHVAANGGVKYQGRPTSFRHCIHVALGPWNGEVQERAQSVLIECEQVSEKTQVTPNSWLQSDVLPVLHGRVTRPDGRPIANAEVQIREVPKEGQRSLDAKDAYTDSRGYYCFDAIRWPYTVGALVHDANASGDGYRYEYVKIKRTLHGTNEVNLVFKEPPAGTAGIKGQMRAHDGTAVKEFSVRVSSLDNEQGDSKECSHAFGFVEYLSHPEGRFEMSGLPAGKYRVALMPTKWQGTHRYDDFSNHRECNCELTEGKTTDITNAIEPKTAWYGRVQFDDGTPAVLSGMTTEILQWWRGFEGGEPIAKVDDKGYFMLPLSDDAVEPFKSEETWLTINITQSPHVFPKLQKQKFPFTLMSVDRENAQALKISRPVFYYGRILYENGRPAVPTAMPWRGARVYILLRCTPATWNSGGIAESLGGLDDQGYFSIVLTNEQLGKIQAGEYSLEIMFPSYEEDRTSGPVGKFPVESLARDRDSLTAYTLPRKELVGKYEDRAQSLDSYYMLEILRSLLQQWQAEHKGELPERLAALSARADAEAFARIAENIQYQPAEPLDHKGEPYVVAYDRNLLEKIKGTHALFSDGRIEFLPERRLGAMDTSK